jgi:hypothetical protein
VKILDEMKENANIENKGHKISKNKVQNLGIHPKFTGIQ